MIDEARMEKAVHYLVETDVECAKAKAVFEELSDLRKTVIAFEYETAREKGSQGDAEHIARKSQDYISHLTKIKNAQIAFETLRNRRNTACVVIDVWRSQNSSKNKGVI